MHRRRQNLLATLGVATVLAASLSGASPAAVESRRELAVCADPNNLPFSNDKLEGFENKIASLIAEELHASVRYTWRTQRQGFLRRTLHTRACDLVMGVPAGLPGVSMTRPYYSSTYVFVSARARDLRLGSFDDPALRSLKIGLHALGAEGANTPPASALARRGLVGNIVGYPMWGDAQDDTDPQGRILAAVATGEIDTAIVWGPFAGYFAKRYGDRLEVSPAAFDPLMPSLAFAYAISLGVRDGDEALKAELQDVLDRRQHDILAILNEYGIPLVGAKSGSSLPEAALEQADGSRH